MTDKILESVKNALGVTTDDFDDEILMHLNSALSTVHQLGIGPKDGIRVTADDLTWAQLIPQEDPRYSSIQTYIFLKVKSIFDPPANSYAVTAMKEQLQEFEWRLNVVREGDTWVPTVDLP